MPLPQISTTDKYVRRFCLQVLTVPDVVHRDVTTTVRELNVYGRMRISKHEIVLTNFLQRELVRAT